MTQIEVKLKSSECAESEDENVELLHYVRRNEADAYFKKIEAFGIERCSHFDIFTKQESGIDGAISWNMLQWACFHGNEKVSKN